MSKDLKEIRQLAMRYMWSILGMEESKDKDLKGGSMSGMFEEQQGHCTWNRMSERENDR